MILGRFSARAVLATSMSGILALIFLGGAVMAAVEGSGYLEGASHVFNVVSTVGFGDGPQSSAGLVFAIAVFVPAVFCWFGLLVVAIEVGYARFQRHALIDDALRPLARRPRERLFTQN